jgi:hypothetical protein
MYGRATVYMQELSCGRAKVDTAPQVQKCSKHWIGDLTFICNSYFRRERRIRKYSQSDSEENSRDNLPPKVPLAKRVSAGATPRSPKKVRYDQAFDIKCNP